MLSEPPRGQAGYSPFFPVEKSFSGPWPLGGGDGGNRCRFPQRWVTSRLVLLRENRRLVDSPSAYRPIVLLDEAGKLFEHIIANRLMGHMGVVGPHFADNQAGFRPSFRTGRSTVDVILRLKRLKEETVSQGEVVMADYLDISNAFDMACCLGAAS